MPLGVREVLLVVRAQNLGSGVLRNLAGDFNNLSGSAKKAAQQQMQAGTSLMAVGTAIGAVGAAGLVFLGKATSAAVDYNRQVALTKTQTYGLKVTMDQLSQAGLDVARNIAVPLDQIQAGLYDIFSSMDVNLTQAKFLLSNFSKEAVAGQVDLSTAERATIGVMNAYHMKVQDVTKVQDIMFNLVKFGVGTYGDFANVIGRVTPSAVRANQTFEETAAMMAFLTRNGLSASNAASSAGRALDAIGKSRDKIQNVGAIVNDALGSKTAAALGFTADQTIKVVDAAGKLLPVNQIMTNLGTALKGLNPTQLNDVLTEMFKGTGGTIQAMRFFDVAIHNFGQLNGLVTDMANSKGALQAAYNVMANTPAMKIQLLKNNFQAFMIVLGQQLLPIVAKVAVVLAGFFKLIGSLPAPVIKTIAIVVGLTSVLLVLTGVILAVVGAWMVFNVLLAATDVELIPIAVTIGLVIAAIVALAVAAYFIVKYWGPISKWFHDMWFDMWHWVVQVWGNIEAFLVGVWQSIASGATTGWNKFFGAIMAVWKKIADFFSGISAWFAKNFDGWWKTHGEAVEKIWNDMWQHVTGTAQSYWNALVAMAKWAWSQFQQIWDAIVTVFKIAWGLIVGVEKVGLAVVETLVKIVWAEIVAIFKTGWDVTVGIFRIAWAVITTGFKIWWAVISAIVKIGWAGIQAIFKIAWDTIVALFSIFLDIITGHWKTALNDIKNLGMQIWNAIKGFLVAVWHAIDAAAVPIWNAIRNGWFTMWHSIYDTTQQVWHNITNFLGQVWSGLQQGARLAVSGLKTIWGGIENVFKIPVNFVIGTVYDTGIRGLWNGVMGAIGLSKFDLPKIPQLASGGRLPGFGGGDRIPILAEAGEAIVDKNRTRKYASLLSMMGVPGFVTGGIVGQRPPDVGAFGVGAPQPGTIKDVLHLAGAAGKMMAAVATGNQTAFANALGSAIGTSGGGAGGQLGAMIATAPIAMMKKAIAGVWDKIMASGSGSQIVQYAMSFLGKIPYVWGGTQVPGGADCSGFIQAIYGHFGINAPRTSEAQGAWVRRSPPVPGGLAFYHSPPGGPDPGHVALVKDALTVISQGGGMGPQLMALNGMPLLWTGIPPSGLLGLSAGTATGGTMSGAQIANLWTSVGGPARAAVNMANIANAESGDNAGAVQQGMPPGLTGWGLWQITPTSGIWQNGAYGNLLNATNNARAALSLYQSSGYLPWASDPVAGALVRSGLTYSNGGMVGYAGGAWRVPQTGPAIVHQDEMVLDANTARRVRAGASAHGVNQNFFITTQEIDPRRHAAELGWELARRSG